MEDNFAIGILYRNENIPCYEELRKPKWATTAELKQIAFEKEQNKFGIDTMTMENI